MLADKIVNQVNKNVGLLDASVRLPRVVATRTKRQKSLALIRAREVAANLSMPMVVLDPDGTIVFYNRSAEAILGDTFENAGELSSDEWAAVFAPEWEDGTPIPMQELPAGVALLEQRPHHMDSSTRASTAFASGLPSRPSRSSAVKTALRCAP